MSEVKLSQRAQNILSIFAGVKTGEAIPIRQQTLAEELGCSRRTIGRALKELKEAGLLVDLGKRHQNRCKLYEIIQKAMTPQAEQQLKRYRSTFEVTFRDWPDWQKYYPQVTWELADETDIHLLWRQTFDRLYVIRANGL